MVYRLVDQLAFFRWLGWIGGEPARRAPKLPLLRRLDPRTLAGRRRRVT